MEHSSKKPTSRKIRNAIVHCADTPKGMDIGVKEIDVWHKERGWSGCGYHYVIRRDGTLETGRQLNVVGAHTGGYNADSIGICLVGGKGGFNFTIQQLLSLYRLKQALDEQFKDLVWSGHNDFNNQKPCPQFDVKALFS